jgi:hypothetical protein
MGPGQAEFALFWTRPPIRRPICNLDAGQWSVTLFDQVERALGVPDLVLYNASGRYRAQKSSTTRSVCVRDHVAVAVAQGNDLADLELLMAAEAKGSTGWTDWAVDALAA